MNATKSLSLNELVALDTDRQICMARFDPEGKLLLTGGYDGVVRRWDFAAEEPAELEPLAAHHGWVERLAVHGDRLYTADTWGQVCAWPYRDEKPEPAWTVADAHDGWIRSLALSDDGNLLATGARDRHVKVFAPEDGKLLHDFDGHEEEVWCVAVHPDGKAVASGDLKGTLKHWDLESGECVRELDFSSMYFYDRIQDVCGLRLLTFIDGGKTLLVAGSTPTRAGRSYGIPTIHVVDWNSGEIKKSLEYGEDKDGYVFDLVQHPDGFLAFATSGPPGQGKLCFYRLEEDEPFLVYEKMSNCHSVALHPDARRLAVAATNRRSQGNGAVTDKEGNYLGNFSPIHFFEIVEEETQEGA